MPIQSKTSKADASIWLTIAFLFSSAFVTTSSLSEANAADLSIGDRIDRGWYFSANIAPTVVAVKWDKNAVSDVVADAFFGIGGGASVCKAGVGSAEWLDLCAGVTGFKSLGSAQKTLSAAVGGGTTETSLYSIGGQLQVKAHLGRFIVAPFAGIGKFHAEKTTNNAAIGYSEADSTYYFAGSELGFSVFDKKAELGLRGQYGRSDGNKVTEKVQVGQLAGFLRVNF